MRLLQAIDSLVFMILMLLFALFTWNNLSGISLAAQQNLRDSSSVLRNAELSLQHQQELSNLIDEHRKTFDLLNGKLLSLAFQTSDFSAATLVLLQGLGQRLNVQSTQLVRMWPETDASGVTSAFKTAYLDSMDTVINLILELTTSPDARWQASASSAQEAILRARQIMEQIEQLHEGVSGDIHAAIQHSIAMTSSKTGEMEQRLQTLKQLALWGAVVTMLLLFVSRYYFSSRFRAMTRSAQKAQRIAEEAVKTKARFLATMSHEIRTPMNGVIGMTRLLMNTPMSRKQTEFVESIRLSGDHLLTVINDVLDFSKIEAGKLDIKQEPLELRACIEDILNLMSAKALEKNLELAYAVDPAVPLFVCGDMVRLRQILANLLGNAIKFTDEGGVSISVSLLALPGDALELEFQVRDTGAGIPKDRLDHVFEQFSQADTAVTRRNEGTGLGLAISRHLVDMMGGRIWVDSTVGAGSCFHFTIQTIPAEGKLKSFLHDNIPAIQGKRLLIVENNLVNAQALSDYCRGWGARVDSMGSSAEAIARLLAGEVYDMGLVDSNLPDSSALEVAAFIRQRYRKQELPLILIAPPNDRHPRDRVRELFNLYLTKPITRSRLYDSLMTVMGEQMVVQPEDVSGLRLAERLPLSVLLAEDNVINQIVATSILDQMGYKADLVENGREALEAVTRKHYDLVFMDMQMPEMDGLEATRRIRSDCPPDRQPVIIAMTANAMDSDKQACLQAGMNDYISKPVLPEAVEATVSRCFAARELPASLKELTDDAIVH